MRAFLLPLLLLSATLALQPAAAQSEPAEAESVPLDPVIASVVRMLEAEVPAETISEWLDRFGSAPGKPTADDLIALTAAGASPDLVRQIMERADAVKSPTPPEPQRETAQTEPLPPVAPPATIPVGFEVRYAPRMVEYQATPWDLFVYIDGRPVARGDGWAAHSSRHLDLLAFDRSLSPGRHVIRLLQEQHVVQSKRKGTWSHRARVFGEPIVLDLESAGNWQVRIDVDEGGGSLRKRQSRYAITRDGETVNEGSGPAAGAQSWPALCEEVEAGLSPDELESKAGRRATKGCVRWASLWKEIQQAPDRATVREEMQGSGFDPVPVASR